LAQGESLDELESALGEIGGARLLLGCLLLIALLHLPLLTYPLVYDDGWVLITNGFLRQPDLKLLLSPDAIALHVPDAFRPTSVLFDVLSYQLFGLHAGAHHLLSILLHLVVCALLWRWLLRLGASLTLASASCLLFGLTGLHAEVIAVVSYREDLLAGGLGLLALLLASDALRRDAAPPVIAAYCVGSGLAVCLACGAKLSAAALPLAWLIFESLHPFSQRRAGSRTRSALLFSSLALGVALALAYRAYLLGGLSPYTDHGTQNLALWSERVGERAVWAASLQIQLVYLLQSLLPVGLSPEYADRGASWFEAKTLFALAALIGLLAVAFVQARADAPRRLFATCVLAFFVLLLPTANLVPMPNMRADRFTYLATLASSVGWSALALALGQALASRMRSDRAGADDHGPSGAQIWLLAPLLTLCTVQASFERAATSAFFSNTTLWETARRRAPESARAHAMYGLMRLASGASRSSTDAQLRRLVREDCERARVLDPLEARVHVCFARLAVAGGEASDAFRHFSRAIALDPAHSVAWLGARAQLSLELESGTESGARQARNLSSARAELERAIAVFPYAEELHLVAGRLAHREGIPLSADRHYARARSLRPERWESVVATLELQLDLGHIPRAHQLWLQEAKLLRHADPATRNHLEKLLHDGGQLGIETPPEP
jgi:tetratricopeptide (TPR) repeat protein